MKRSLSLFMLICLCSCSLARYVYLINSESCKAYNYVPCSGKECYKLVVKYYILYLDALPCMLYNGDYNLWDNNVTNYLYIYPLDVGKCNQIKGIKCEDIGDCDSLGLQISLEGKRPCFYVQES